MARTLQDAYDSFAIAAWEKQMRLNDLVGDADWELDLDAETISFDGSSRWKMQVLGSESDESDTWLWAWANSQSGLPESVVSYSRRVRDYGEKHDIDELFQPDFPLDWANGHFLSAIAVGVCEADAYYRCPHDSGAVYVLIHDPGYPRRPSPSTAAVASSITEAIANLEIRDHKAAIAHYLRHRDAIVDESDNSIEAKIGGGSLTARFDSFRRLTELSTTQSS